MKTDPNLTPLQAQFARELERAWADYHDAIDRRDTIDAETLLIKISIIQEKLMAVGALINYKDMCVEFDVLNIRHLKR